MSILRALKIKIPHGETVLACGMRLPIVSREEQTVTVQYMGENHAIPSIATDLR